MVRALVRCLFIQSCSPTFSEAFGSSAKVSDLSTICERCVRIEKGFYDGFITHGRARIVIYCAAARHLLDRRYFTPGEEDVNILTGLLFCIACSTKDNRMRWLGACKRRYIVVKLHANMHTFLDGIYMRVQQGPRL